MKLVEVAKVGDYVEYDALISDEKSFEEIPREHMNWRVLKNDGENVVLISEAPKKTVITLNGAKGYLEGPNKLDKIADELYSSEIGKARNLKIEDVNELLGYKANKVQAYAEVVPYGTKISKLEEMFQKKLKYRQTPDGKVIGEYGQTYYWYNGDEYKEKDSIEYQLIFGKKDEYSYWLSSSCAGAYFFYDVANFGVRYVYGGNVGSNNLYNSYGDYYSNSCSARPVVALSSSVLVAKEQAGGKTAETAWKIKEV